MISKAQSSVVNDNKSLSLFDIALRNVRRNFYSYFLYFISMVFSITIYYIFTSIQYNKQVLQLAGSNTLTKNTFEGNAMIIAVFSAMFIWYSNSFFTRKRKKEIALYSLLGVKKKQVGQILFYENLLIGTIALAFGILMGSALSKLFIMLLTRLMGFNAIINFEISYKAIKNTALVFALIFLIASLHGYTLIYRFKLIELFKADNARDKEPKSSIILSVLSLLLIGSGYFFYIKFTTVLQTLIAVVIGTYFLFTSLAVFIVKIARKHKSSFYRGINMIGTSQLAHRIKANARTLATIAVLSATTLTAMEVVSSIYYDSIAKLSDKYSFTYAYVSPSSDFDRKVEGIIKNYPANSILSSIDAEFIRLSGNIPDTVRSKRLSAGFNSSRTLFMMSESNYTEITKTKGIKNKVKLNSDNDVFVFDEQFISMFQKDYTGKTLTLNLGNTKKSFSVSGLDVHSLVNLSMTPTVIIVKDSVYKETLSNGMAFRIRGYITEDPKSSNDLDNNLINEIKSAAQGTAANNAFYSSYYSHYKANMLEYGLLIFVGTFLGLVFLVCTGSIIFFRQLSEATYDTANYKILRNIGVSKKEIKSIISRQILIIFALPLVVGITHSLVANVLMKQVFRTDFTIPVLITISIYTLIYMGYYLVTVNSYNKIVNSN